MTVLQTMWDKAVIIRIWARCVFVLGAVLASLSLVAPPRAHAIDPERHISQYGHTAWRVFDGTIPRPVAITQTTDGYIWLATTDGLMRFDGVRFSLWRSIDGEPLIKRFSALLGASDGGLWIGTLNGLMHLQNGTLYTYARPHEKAAIANIVQDRAGTIWVSRYHVPKGSGPLCRAGEAELVCYGAKDGVPARYTLALTQDSDGYFWFGGDVLCRWRPGSAATCFDETGRRGRTRMDIQELTSGPSGPVWTAIDAVGPQFGVRYFSGGKWRPFIVPGFDGPSVRSHGLYVDRHNSLWVGTENNGIYRIHDGVADHYASPDGLSGNAVRSFYEDREGNLWVITDSGLDMFRDTPVVSYSMAQGLFASWISSILARRDGSIWIGNQGAIDILRNGQHSLLSARDMSGDSLVTLFEDHAQTVWLGLDRALLAYQNGRVFSIRRPDGSPLRQNSEFPVTEDVDGNIWALGTSGHLFRIKGREIAEDIQLGESLTSAFLLEADKNGGLWIGSKGGNIARYHAGQLETYSLKDDRDPISIHEMIVDTDNALLISTERGLVRWSNGQHTALGIKNGLPCESIYSAIKDDNGSLWLYARCGLVQVDASQVAKWEGSPSSPISARVFDAHDGAFPAIQAARQHISSKAPDGRLWFTNGALAQVVDPKHLSRNEVMPPVAIEDLIADRKVLGVRAGMRVPALTRDLQIDYTALSFVVPQKVHFQYKLEGYDRDWQDAGTRRQAFYSNIPPRDYTFRVKACNNSGLWNEAGASLDFFVAPAYYQTNWFRLSCLAAFIALLWVLHRWRVHQLKSQEKRLREAVETIPAMTFTTSSDGSNTFVNKRWTEYTGLSVEKTSGAGWQRAIYAEDLARTAEKWRVSVATGQLFEDEARYRRATDGEYRWFLVRGVPLRDQRGRIVKWYGTLTDIEDRKRAEQEREKLRELEADLAHINRVSMMGEMAASLAHEIKQPIAAAMTSANSCIEWLAHQPPNLDRARAAAAKIDKYGNRAAEIIDRIRSLYKKSPPQRELVNVNGIIQEMLTLLKCEADRYSVAMRMELAAEPPKIMADPVQLQQVFMNLMLNGIEAMRDSGGALTVKSQMQDGQVQFSVSDTGVGLPTEKMDQIFSAFFTTKPQGSGMGLAISRSIVESHGGRLWATTNDGRGATFHFTLPTHVMESALAT
jgi:PAS domain S-box-containing protein